MSPTDALTAFLTTPNLGTFISLAVVLIGALLATNATGVWGWGRAHRAQVARLEAQLKEVKEDLDDKQRELERWQSLCVEVLLEGEHASGAALAAVGGVSPLRKPRQRRDQGRGAEPDR